MKTIKNHFILLLIALPLPVLAQPVYQVRPALGGQGWDIYAPKQRRSEQSELQIPNPNTWVAPAVRFPTVDPDAFQKGADDANRRFKQSQEIEQIRQQNRLLQQRARIEAQQHQEFAEANRALREADIAEARLRKELAAAKLAELQAAQAVNKSQQEAAESVRRKEAQARYDKLAEQLQRELAEEKAKAEAKRVAKQKSEGTLR